VDAANRRLQLRAEASAFGKTQMSILQRGSDALTNEGAKSLIKCVEANALRRRARQLEAFHDQPGDAAHRLALWRTFISVPSQTIEVFDTSVQPGC
jgi:hypothetical protein